MNSIIADSAFAGSLFHKDPSTGTLATQSTFINPDNVAALKAKLICDTIEKRVLQGPGTANLEDIAKWGESTEECFKNAVFFKWGPEVHILVNNSILIRYFNKDSQYLGYLYENSKSLISETDVSPSCVRQLYKVYNELPAGLSLEDIFKHIIKKAGLSENVNILIATFPVKSSQYPVCQLYANGRLVIHPEFALDYEDMMDSNVGFNYTFEDGVTRWIGLAESVVYRVAMHEFALKGREGKGHGFIDENGKFGLSLDAAMANKVGRRYSVVDDALWLWYLHSYKISDKIRYDNNEFLRRINWIFTNESKAAQAARAEFPNLSMDKEKRREAIRLALLVNTQFFNERKHRGVDPTPLYESRGWDLTKRSPDGDVFSVASTEGGEYRHDEVVISPEDGIEIPGRNFMLKPDRTNLGADERSAVELRMDIIALFKELRLIHAAYRMAVSNEELTAVKEREKLFTKRLKEFYTSIPIEIQEGRRFSFYSKAIKELKKRYAQLQNETEAAYLRNDKKSLLRLNQESIRVLSLLLKARLRIAGMFITGRSRLQQDTMMRNAGLWSLKGAYYAARELKEELRFRTARITGRKKIQEIETTDIIGKLVKTFRLGAFDIEVLEPARKRAEAKVVVRQQRWINIHSFLDDVRKLVKKGAIREATARVDMLIELYSVRENIILERYKDVASGLVDLKDMLRMIPDVRAPPTDIVIVFSEAVKELSSKITHPKQRLWLDIQYENLGKSLKSQIETIARYEPEYLLILENKAGLEYYAEKIKHAKATGSLTQRDKSIVLDGLRQLTDWVKRGFVHPKQEAAYDLGPASVFVNNSNWTEALECIDGAAKQMDRRLADIENIIENIKKRTASIYSEFRDTDVTARINAMKTMVDDLEYDKAISGIQEVRGRYFSESMSEPGYIRIADTLNITESMLRGKTIPKNTATLARIYANLDLIKSDIEHKYSFRINVVLKDGSQRFVYPNPGTTVSGLLSMLRENQRRTLVSIGSGYRPAIGSFKTMRLRDNSTVSLAEADAAVQATEGEEYRNAGPGASGARASASGMWSAWTKEQVAKIPYAIKALHDNGIDISPYTMQKDASDKTKEILKNVLGRPNTSGNALYQKAFREIGNWDEALRKAGLDPAKIIKAAESWTDEQIANIPGAIKALHDNKIDVNSGAISNDISDKTKEILKKVLGRSDITGKYLYAKVYKTYKNTGGWNKILIEAGLDPEEIRKKSKDWTDEQIAKIPEAIKVLYNNGIDVNARAMYNDVSDKTKKILEKILGRPNTTGRNLYGMTLKTYKKIGGWNGALMQAGLDPVEISKAIEDWTDEQIAKIPEAIKALHEDGIDVNVRAMRNNASDKTKEILEKVIGRPNTTGMSLYLKAHKIYKETGGWNGALMEAELDPEEIRKKNEDWTDEQIAKIPDAIKALHDNKIDVNAGAISNDKSDRTKEILEKVLGRPDTTGLRLHSKTSEAYKETGGWNEALRKSGLKPEEIAADPGSNNNIYGINSYIGNIRFPSRLERDTAMILLISGAIPDVIKGTTWQVFLGGQRERPDFYSPKLNAFFEPHRTPKKGDGHDAYFNKRRALLDANGYADSKLYIYSKVTELYKILEQDFGIKITADERAVIKDLVRAEDTSELALAAATERAEYRKKGPGASKNVNTRNSASGKITDTMINAPYRKIGPGTEGYRENGDLIRIALNQYAGKNIHNFAYLLKETSAPILHRIPVDALKMIGKKNAELFLAGLKSAPNVTIELYAAGESSLTTEKYYKKYGLEKPAFSEARDRANTLTYLLVEKDEKLTWTELSARIGDSDISPKNTLIMPIGLKRDLSGLSRATILGLRLMKISRNIKEKGAYDQAFVAETLDDYKAYLEESDNRENELTFDDIINLAAGSTNDIIRALNKLIRLIPMTPIDTEELKAIYERIHQVLVAA